VNLSHTFLWKTTHPGTQKEISIN